jgi:C1A family cysteine protease
MNPFNSVDTKFIGPIVLAMIILAPLFQVQGSVGPLETLDLHESKDQANPLIRPSSMDEGCLRKTQTGQPCHNCSSASAISDSKIGKGERGLGWLKHEENVSKAMMKPEKAKALSLPTFLDWRNRGGVDWITPIRDQEGCGSCVAFGTTAAVEAMFRIQTNNPTWNLDLSEQHLFSCGGGSCSIGWYISSALNYYRDHGTPDESCFPYQAQDLPCSNSCPDWQSKSHRITSWSWVSNDIASIETFLQSGPVVAAIDVYTDFFTYSGGVYTHKTGSLAGGHCISIVGYNNTGRYWICKNSWGSWWGEQGWFRIAFGECGIEDYVARITIIQNAPPTAFLDNITPNPATQNQSISFSGHGADSDGYVVAYNWQSSVDGQLSTSASFNTTSLSAGVHTIFFKVKDNLGAWSATATKTVIVTGTSSTYTEFWFTWYDTASNNGLHNIHFLNPSSSKIANVTLTIPDWQQTGYPPVTYSFALSPGQASFWNSKNYPPNRPLIGGPVHITSNNPIWVTERITGWSSFKEIPGIPADKASTDIYYTWYDYASPGASIDDIHVLNPSSSQTANVHITIPDSRPSYPGVEETFTVSPGQDMFKRYPNVIGGPVHVTSNIPVISTQRVTGWGDFDEIIGLPSSCAYRENWFNWYDSQGASQDNIHLLNLGNETAQIDVYVAGAKQGPTLYVIAGNAYFISYPNLKNGPVRILSDQPIRASQRITGWGGFNEVFSVPSQQMAEAWYFTWYDTASGAQINNIHFTNPSTADTATVKVTITDARPGYPGVNDTFTLGPGLATYKSYPNVIGGPVFVSSNTPILASQRLYGWNSFDEILGSQ